MRVVSSEFELVCLFFSFFVVCFLLVIFKFTRKCAETLDEDLQEENWKQNWNEELFGIKGQSTHSDS